MSILRKPGVPDDAPITPDVDVPDAPPLPDVDSFSVPCPDADGETVCRKIRIDRTRCPKCGEKWEDCTCLGG